MKSELFKLVWVNRLENVIISPIFVGSWILLCARACIFTVNKLVIGLWVHTDVHVHVFQMNFCLLWSYACACSCSKPIKQHSQAVNLFIMKKSNFLCSMQTYEQSKEHSETETRGTTYKWQNVKWLIVIIIKAALLKVQWWWSLIRATHTKEHLPQNRRNSNKISHKNGKVK